VTAPPWGHKPDAVDNCETYWSTPPPTLSPRVGYWLKRLTDGTWRPNRRFNRECGQCRAGLLGVYIWEYQHVIAPALAGRDSLAQGAA
jgi:hypothetical protein